MSMSLAAAAATATTGHAQDRLKDAVDAAVAPVRTQYGVPGLIVGVTVNGKHTFYRYGVASRASGAPVRDDTLFEIGSLTKTFTATLACYAQGAGKLDFAAPASRYVGALRGSVFDRVSALNLGTHTSGLPLFEPDDVTNEAQLIAYYRRWQPAQPVGTQRVYSNLGIGLLGMVTAQSLGEPFHEAVQQRLLPAFGMTHTWLDVPAAHMPDYAQGYDAHDTPLRLHPGVLADEAYGMRTTAPDLVRYLDANMGLTALPEPWQRALACTHTGYYKAAAITQDLVWEQYPWPVTLATLQSGNGPDMLRKGMPATAITPPLPPQTDALINKTGSTNGFSTYTAFVPSQKIGVVILANKAYPIDARVRAGYAILTALAKEKP
ncbi:class C beta-lactamase [Paraburkholderia tropica]|uniref:class C beta-lactamase n=1 Tax=Paraburkholderia tropica TaxID=92647 RepID=UPI002AB0239F|nr:class C beta-lactamase [Paraburkholderia tropica]